MADPALSRRRLLPSPWLWDYLAGRPQRRRLARATPGPVHLMFLFVDHYEPEDQATVDAWVRGYPAMAGAHRDADGRPPQYGWFWYFPDAEPATEARYLQRLSVLPFGGWGEVDLHLHHDNDTEATLTADLHRRLQLSNEFGLMLTGESVPRRAYGFIHGMWALDNSRLGRYCGVNNELQVLKATGCYADYTMAAWGPMQSRWVNRLYMATDDPHAPKSYDTGMPVRVGRTPDGDLLMMQGPTVMHWEQLWRRRRPVYDHGDVTAVEPPSPWRLDRWVRQWIHVEGRPEWVFVKVYTHGAVARDVPMLLGPQTGAMFGDLERRYNDGKRFVLHYVTAREAYNIIRAAADGKGGNPHAYRDYALPPPVSRWAYSTSRMSVKACRPGEVFGARLLDPGEQALALNAWALRTLRGAVTAVSWRQYSDHRQGQLSLTGTGPLALEFSDAVRVAPEGGDCQAEGRAVRLQGTGVPRELVVEW